MTATTRVFVVAALIVGLALALFLSPFASGAPDGLEKVATEEGFDVAARDHDLAESPLADYRVEGVDDDRLSTGLAGVAGVILTFAIGVGLFGLVRARRSG